MTTAWEVTSTEVVCVQVTEVYQERRLDAVFAMWDQNSDQRISFKELCEGLYRLVAWALGRCSQALYYCAQQKHIIGVVSYCMTSSLPQY